MRHLTYLIVLAVCLASAVWLEPVLRVGVLRRWRHLLVLVVPAAVFVAWDVAAIAARQWWYDPAQLVGLTLPGRLPLEELLFFAVVPLCAVWGFEAVRRVTGWRLPGERGPAVARRHRPGDTPRSDREGELECESPVEGEMPR